MKIMCQITQCTDICNGRRKEMGQATWDGVFPGGHGSGMPPKTTMVVD